MGDTSLRCLDCQGKFGAICSDLRCALCGTLFRLKGLVLSEAFPEGAGHFAEVSLRDVYFKNLEAGEAKVLEEKAQGGIKEEPPGVIDKRPLEAPPLNLQTTPKAKPAEKGEPGKLEEKRVEGLGGDQEVAERATSAHRPREKSKHKKRHHRRSEEEEENKDKKKRRRSRTPGRSRSRTLRDKPERVAEERPPLPRQSERKQRDRPRDSRERARGSYEHGRGDRSVRPRSPLRPRSPPGPPRLGRPIGGGLGPFQLVVVASHPRETGKRRQRTKVSRKGNSRPYLQNLRLGGKETEGGDLDATQDWEASSRRPKSGPRSEESCRCGGGSKGPSWAEGQSQSRHSQEEKAGWKD